MGGAADGDELVILVVVDDATVRRNRARLVHGTRIRGPVLLLIKRLKNPRQGVCQGQGGASVGWVLLGGLILVKGRAVLQPEACGRACDHLDKEVLHATIDGHDDAIAAAQLAAADEKLDTGRIIDRKTHAALRSI